MLADKKRKATGTPPGGQSKKTPHVREETPLNMTYTDMNCSRYGDVEDDNRKSDGI